MIFKIPFTDYHIGALKRSRPEGRSAWQLRSNDGQGAMSAYFNNFVFRKNDAVFYEVLREGIPIIDAAIFRLTSLDGHIEIEGEKGALVDEIKDFIYNVPVNDVQTGLQAFHQNFTNEAHEQGFTLTEFITNKKRNDIVELKVADSKTIKFKRTDKGLEYWQKADGDTDWRPIKKGNVSYYSIHNENQNPYGVSMMRSLEFVSKILATIHNSLGNVWERFGDPSYEIIYKTKNKEDLNVRRAALESEFTKAMTEKREGRSADFVRAIHTDASIAINVIGHQNQILELEVPARHVLEQIVAKTGLPPWMLGLHWSTSERLSNAEASMLLADVTTRQAAKMPTFHRLISTLLTLRGRKWKRGDWSLKWAQINLHDIEKQARADFLLAQADMYYLRNAAEAGIEITREDLHLGKRIKKRLESSNSKSEPLKLKGQVQKAGGQGVETQKTSLVTRQSSVVNQKETRPFAWPALDKLEKEYEGELKYDWHELGEKILTILGIQDPTATNPEPEPNRKDSKNLQSEICNLKSDPNLPSPDQFTFSEEQRAAIFSSLENYLGEYELGFADSAVTYYYSRAYSLGLIQAVEMIGKERPILDIIKNKETFDKLRKEGFALLKDNATKAILTEILPEIEAQALAGTNPVHVAARLKKLFGDQNSDWERLARSELSMAGERAKLDEWKEWKIKKVTFLTAPDACPICIALIGEYDINKAPLPVRDTHPRCRCTLVAA